MELTEQTTATITMTLDEATELLNEIESLRTKEYPTANSLAFILTPFVYGDNR